MGETELTELAELLAGLSRALFELHPASAGVRDVTERAARLADRLEVEAGWWPDPVRQGWLPERDVLPSRDRPDRWRQPSGAHDAYPEGAEVVHDGGRWVSTIDANVFVPGVSGWRMWEAGAVYPTWVQPSGTHDAYQTGDRVVHDGSVYESRIDANTTVPGTDDRWWSDLDGGFA